MTPWNPHGHDDHLMVKIEQAPAVQLDFSGVLCCKLNDG